MIVALVDVMMPPLKNHAGLNKDGTITLNAGK